MISPTNNNNSDLAIRVNVRYVAPPESKIKDALELFRSPSWVQFIVRYIMPQLNNASPAAASVLNSIQQNQPASKTSSDSKDDDCVVCMDSLSGDVAKLSCGHSFHTSCLVPWLKIHSTCPTCRHQLPTDAGTLYSVQAINTTIVLGKSQAAIPTDQLLELDAGNQTIQAVVNARVRRNVTAVPTRSIEIPEEGNATETAAALVQNSSSTSIIPPASTTAVSSSSTSTMFSPSSITTRRRRRPRAATMEMMEASMELDQTRPCTKRQRRNPHRQARASTIRV